MEFNFWIGVVFIVFSSIAMLITKDMDFRLVLAFVWGWFLVIYESLG